LPAIAHEAQISFNLDDIGRIFERTPLLADLQPGGRYWASDLHKVGGVPTVMRAIARERRAQRGLSNHLGPDDRRGGRGGGQPDGVVVRSAGNPIAPAGGVVVLKGNLAPEGRPAQGRGAQQHHHEVPRDAF